MQIRYLPSVGRHCLLSMKTLCAIRLVTNTKSKQFIVAFTDLLPRVNRHCVLWNRFSYHKCCILIVDYDVLSYQELCSVSTHCSQNKCDDSQQNSSLKQQPVWGMLTVMTQIKEISEFPSRRTKIFQIKIWYNDS